MAERLACRAAQWPGADRGKPSARAWRGEAAQQSPANRIVHHGGSDELRPVMKIIIILSYMEYYQSLINSNYW